LRYIFKNSGVTTYIYTKDEITEEEKMQLIRELHINPLGGNQGRKQNFQKIVSRTSLERDETTNQGIYKKMSVMPKK